MIAVDFIARCIAGENATDIEAIINEIENIQKQIGDLNFIKLSKEEFDKIEEKDHNTIYYVADGDTITQYIGSKRITNGVGSGGTGLLTLNGVNHSTISGYGAYREINEEVTN